MSFDYAIIDEYQIEITTYCNAACPQCPRNQLGQGLNPYMPLTHLDRSVIDRAFDAQLCANLRQIFFCGSTRPCMGNLPCEQDGTETAQSPVEPGL